MTLTSVKKIKTTNNEKVANDLLAEDWVLIETSRDNKGLVYHLGYIPGITKKMEMLKTRKETFQGDIENNRRRR